ncbi:cation:proton antiporter [Synechococcus sp. RSCCF101]|uniref:cation:proton antiporter n=1 Tax=Synechococcus sp. RSCCF101 TaxID=2511069 RepID=UPI0012475794|nr:cation:proton antiporter [Synechococcus sp. RSCCF101]QEY33292.1 cation:proton antiporter [Synechococcus sp. RSCCF101]
MEHSLADQPLSIFALLLAITVVVPPLVRRLGLPELVGLLLAGIAAGPHVAGWLDPASETVELLSEIGAVYLLFTVGLEIDLDEFSRVRGRSALFGVLVFVLGVSTGFGIGWGFGYPLVACLLLGALMATHTPLGYPIVRSYGAMADESVIVSVGSTILTDIAALLLLAVGLGMGRGSLSGEGLAGLLLGIGLFAVVVVWGIRWSGRRLIQMGLSDDNRLFLAVLLALFLASLGAELAGVEKIVGAFLAGLAVNSVLPEGRVKEQVIFVGGVLFIPIFFIHLGLLLDLGGLLNTLASAEFTVVMLVGAIASKGLASALAGRLFGYSRPQVLMMWSLAMPKVAATLAAAFVGFRAGLLDERVLSSVLAVMVVTATLGPILTARAVPRLVEGDPLQSLEDEGQDPDWNHSGAVAPRSLTVLVPIANPRTEAGLLAMAARLLPGEGGGAGSLVPLAVVCPSLEERRGGLGRAMAAARARLRMADALGGELQVPTSTMLRLDEDIPGGMSRSALERGADLVLMGGRRPDRLRRWLFGDLVDGVCRTAHCPVVVVSLQGLDPGGIRTVLVPLKDLSASAREQFGLALRLLGTNSQGVITLLHVHDPRLGSAERSRLRQELEHWAPPRAGHPRVRAVVLPGPGVEEAIRRLSGSHELVILRSQRRKVAGLPVPASDLASRLVAGLSAASMVISEPIH